MRRQRFRASAGREARYALRDQESQFVPLHGARDRVRGAAPDRDPGSRRAVEQETRLYDPERDETRSLRTKEEAHDYRYFPDPDLLPLVVEERWSRSCAARCPSCPRRSAHATSKWA